MTTTTLIPTYNQKSYSITTSVDNIQCNIVMNWNFRTEHYHFSVLLQDGTYIVEGQKLIVGYPIQTSQMFEAGIKGAFYLTPQADTVEDNATTRESIADNFLFSYVT